MSLKLQGIVTVMSFILDCTVCLACMIAQVKILINLIILVEYFYSSLIYFLVFNAHSVIY